MSHNSFQNGSVIFKGNKDSSWGHKSAHNPIDSISLTMDDSPQTLYSFVKKHEGHFLAGFITYEYGVKQLGIPINNPLPIPAVQFFAYDSFNNSQNEMSQKSSNKWNSFESNISMEHYYSNYQHIINSIISGDIYQLNYTHLLESQTELDPKTLFNAFREKNNVGYSALIEGDGWAIHSLSPEQFIHIKNGLISTKPIKGTAPRGITPEEDSQHKNDLLNSEKEQAELYMIIDLLRNDLGKVCQTGSVSVLESKSVQSLEKVFHTYGRIQGKLKNNIQPIEALVSMSPGGSISGCPKKRACEIISEIELSPRGVYTGSIGYILPDGSLHFNIAIRTVTQMGEQLTLGVGGGITVGSHKENEYNETLIKANSLQPYE